MRILFAHPGVDYSVHDVYAGWLEALQQLAYRLIPWNLHDRLCFYDNALTELEERGPAGETLARKALTQDQAVELAVNGIYAALYKTRPHVLMVVSGFFLPVGVYDLARASGTRVVILHTESPYEDSRQLALAEHADLNLVNDPTNLELFRSVAPTEYVPHAYRPSVHHPGAPTRDLVDFAFVGTGFASRIAFFEAMTLPARTLLAGNWRQLATDSPLLRYVDGDPVVCMDNESTADVYRAAKCGLNLYRREADAAHLAAGWAMGPREVEMAACGLFFLRDPRPEGDELLHMLPTFTSPADASEQLEWWLRHDAERDKAALAAREAVADRTFSNHAKALLRLIEGG